MITAKVPHTLNSFHTVAALTPAPKKVKTSAKMKMTMPKPVVLEQNIKGDKLRTQKGKQKTQSSSSSNVSKPSKLKKNNTEKVDMVGSCSEDEDFDKDIDSDDASFVPPPRQRAVRGTKKITYQEDSDSDEDFAFDED
jgi:hypothetical protein